MIMSGPLRFLAASALAAAPPAAPDAIAQRVERVLRAMPVIDGHNDLPWEIRTRYRNWQAPLDLEADTAHLAAPLQTDLPRMRRGHLGAQFWSVWIPATLRGPE